MTYYISGPMSGLPQNNLAAFAVAAITLRSNGHITIYPGCPLLPSRGSYRTLLRNDLVAICDKADALYMLKGWEHSPGARAEHAVALALKLPIEYEGDQK